MMNEREPLISIITPVHDFPLDLIKRAWQSVKMLKYENLEWLLGLHNMDDESFTRYRELFAEDKRVQILQVNGPMRVGYARNQLLDRVKGDYIFFLDGDDEFSGDGILRVVRVMEKMMADMAVFNVLVEDEIYGSRRTALSMTEKEERSEEAIETETDLFYDREEPGVYPYLSGCGGALWCRCYRSSFLKRTGIRMNEELKVTSDLDFNLRLARLSDRTLILPKICGYIYHVRPDNMLMTDARESRLGNHLTALESHLKNADRENMDANELLWSEMARFMILAPPGISEKGEPEAGGPADLKKKLVPFAQRLRVISPGPFLFERDLHFLSKHISALYPELSESMKKPRLKQRLLFTPHVLVEGDLQNRLKMAVRENPKLQMTADGNNPFLGRIRTDTLFEAEYVDLRNMALRPAGDPASLEDPAAATMKYTNLDELPDALRRYLTGFQHLELLQGFDPEKKPPLRVSVFRLNGISCAISFTWDERFLHDCAIDRLYHTITALTSIYRPHFHTIRDMLYWLWAEDESRVWISFLNEQGVEDLPIGKLIREMRALGSYLYRHQIRNRRVALVGYNSYEWVLTFFTLVCGNNTVVALDPSVSEKTLLLRLKSLDCRVLAGADALCTERLEEEGISLLRYSEYPSMIREGEALLEAGYTDYTKDRPTEETDAVIMFTSGTTGFGKAVPLTHKNLVSSATSVMLKNESYTHSMVVLPLYHIVALSIHLLCNIFAHIRCTIVSDPKLMLHTVRDQKVTFSILVPRLATMILSWLREQGDDVRKKYRNLWFKAIDIGGAASDSSLASDFARFGIECRTGYGMTEASGVIMTEGESYKDLEIRIDGGQDRGEILLRGPQIFKGYLNDPAANARSFKDGWFRTGDIGYFDERGLVHITGRIKNLIILSNGENVSPEEIEEVLGGSKLIRDCVVYESGDRIAADIVPEDESCFEAASKEEAERMIKEEVERLEKQLPSYMHLSHIHILKELKTTSLGKTVRDRHGQE